MRKLVQGMTVAAVVMAFGGSVLAKTETVTGKVVDEGCSLSADHKMPAEEMASCAVMCAKNGEPLALLTADGKVYRITGGLAANKNAKLIEHVNKTVEITGDVTTKDGKVQIAADTLRASK
jgi:hypothetical protein